MEDLTKVGRNDPCPCGSGKKFKKCHLGREGDLYLRKSETLDPEAGKKICALPEVRYGRSREIIEALVQGGSWTACRGSKALTWRPTATWGSPARKFPGKP